jgi:predicted Zn-dependent protease with MMP-like domain
MSPTHLENVADTVIRQVLGRLPAAIREKAGDCPVVVEWIEQAAADDPELPDDLLGLFEGRAFGEPDDESPASLPRIRLFLDNIWEHAGRDRKAFREELRITLLHEIGHYLGLDEAQVEALGLA